MSEFRKDSFSSSPFEAQHSASGGLLGAVRQFISTLLETAQVRLELLGTELESEKRRLLDVVVLVAVALVCLALGLVMLCAAVVLLVDEAWRLAAAGAMALFLLGTGLAMLGWAKWRLRNPLGIFHASAQELARDRGQE